jgi:hypothetical protein
MNTDENRGKQAVKRLERAYAPGREYPNSTLTLKAQTAADLLDYVAELEAQVEQVNVNFLRPQVDRVEVIDNTGRAYVNMEAGSVSTCLQDKGKTLKVFIQ